MEKSGRNNHIPKVGGPVRLEIRDGRNTPPRQPPKPPTYVKPAQRG